MVDEVLCTNGCIDAWIKESKLGVLYKFDIEKTYDHVNWAFMIYVMRRFGFRVR